MINRAISSFVLAAAILLMGSSHRLAAQEPTQDEGLKEFRAKSMDQQPESVRQMLLKARRPWTVVYDLSEEVNVASNPERLYHSPALIVAPNGDWLCAWYDSRGKTRLGDHIGTDAVISQARSTDQGETWKPEGIVVERRESGCLATGPAYGVSADGVIVLVAQCRHLTRADEIPGEHIDGSVYLVSRDNGKTYEYRGLVDPEVPQRHQGSTTQILRVGKTLFMPAICNSGVKPYGVTFYTTDDPLRGWRYAGWIFRMDQMPVEDLSYPQIIQRRGGSLLALCVDDSRIERDKAGPGEGPRNFQSISNDNGKTWSLPRELPQTFTLGWHNSLDYAGDVLVAAGRDKDRLSVAAFFSPDDGETWGCPITLDRYGFRGWGGYAATLRTKIGDVFVAFSTDSHTAPDARPTIRGVFLRNVKVRRSTGLWPFE